VFDCHKTLPTQLHVDRSTHHAASTSEMLSRRFIFISEPGMSFHLLSRSNEPRIIPGCAPLPFARIAQASGTTTAR
jgi:hypothetical protein